MDSCLIGDKLSVSLFVLSEGHTHKNSLEGGNENEE